MEETSVALEITSQLLRIDYVAIVCQSEVPRIVSERKGLHVVQTPASGRRVTDVAYGHRSGQMFELLLREDLRHQTQTLLAVHRLTVEGDYTAPLLTAVLKTVQRIIGYGSGVGYIEGAENTALLM